MRTENLYITSATRRDMATAAKLLGVQTADELAETWLRQKLDKMPEIAERRELISAAVAKAMKEWSAKHPAGFQDERALAMHVDNT